MILFVTFVVAPLIELYVLIKTGQAIGVFSTLALLVLFAFVGMALVRREGVRVWGRFVQTVQAGQTPSKEIADGVCVLLAGALFIAPGLVSDAVALLLLFPPTRAIFRRFLLRRKSFGGLGHTRIITATYGGRMADGRRSDGTVTDTTSTESRGELDP
ncbi:MAG: FxsA family protein [Ilumatobacteraceae bacterium]|nr:FxsA family protein [Ilumatobacteraceae bacterium]